MIEDSRLAGGDRILGFRKANPGCVMAKRRDYGVCLKVAISDTGLHGYGFFWRSHPNPVDMSDCAFMSGQFGFAPDDQAVFFLVKANDIVGLGPRYADPPALSYRVGVETLVFSQYITAGIDDRSGLTRKSPQVRKKVFVTRMPNKTQLLAFSFH